MNNDLIKTVQNIKDSGCNRCTDLCAIRKQIVVSRGNPNADVVIVGQNPGAQEDVSGYPFMGVSGQLLNDIIDHLGYSEDDFFFTNVVMCHTEGNAQPSQTHIKNCSTNLKSVLKSFDKIVTLGRFAAQGVAYSYDSALVSRLSLARMKDTLTKGNPYRLDDSKRLYCTYHPSYLLRSGVTKTKVNNELFRLVANEIRYAKAANATGDSDLTNLTTGSLF